MASAMVCESCRGGHYEDKIILCDRCDRGWHLFCLTPPLRKVPKGNWVCPICDAARKGDLQQGVFGEELSMADFEAKAKDFDDQWYGDIDGDSVSHRQREREFWNLVAGVGDMAEVLYANDPRVQLKRTDAQKKKGFAQIPMWKNQFSENLAMYCEGSKQGSSIPGVHAGRLEFGMTFSSTPWKVQEQLLYSSTYLHSGAMKQWYCIPAYASSMFDSLMQQLYSDYMVSMEWEHPLGPNLMVSPETLMDRGVPVYGCTQEKGTLVICYPNSYNCSVNLGLNMSESLLMVLPDWLRISSQAMSLYRNHRVPPLFSVEKAILNAFTDVHTLGCETKYWISLEFSRIVQEESMLRHKLWGEGLRKYRKIPLIEKEEDDTEKKEGSSQKSDPHCVACRCLLPFSMVECPCSPKKVACLHHRQNLCKCKISRHCLAWKYSITELEEMCERFSEGVSNEDREYLESTERDVEEDVKQAIGQAVGMARASEEAMREVVMTKHLQEQNNKKRGPKSKKAKNGGTSRALDAPCEFAMTGYCPLEPGAPLTLVTECGYVQGPIRQFSHLDMHPEDFQSLEVWQKEIEMNCRKWMMDAQLALDEGGNRAFDLPDLIEEGDEYLWGSINPTMKEKIAELCPKLQKADDFVESIFVALNTKPPLEDIEKILATDPLPLKSPPKLDVLKGIVEKANEWIQKHASVVSDLTVDPPLDSKYLDAVVAEASKIPATIPEAKAVRERLAVIKKVAEAVRIALPKNRDTGRRKNTEEPLTLEFIEKLHQDATEAHIMMPEIITLEEAFNKIKVWREKVESALEKRSLWSVYEELIEEGKSMPCEMPDIERLYELQDSVSIWISEMNQMMASNAPLKKMRELVDRGYQLPILFPDVDKMAEYIQKFEWEESAERCIHSCETVESIKAIIASKPNNEKVVSEIIPSLEKKIADSEAWASAAAQFANRHSSSLPTLEEVEDLVNQGQQTGVKMELLDDYVEKLAKAHKWMHRCTKCLSSVSDAPLAIPEVSCKRAPMVDSVHPLVRQKLFWNDSKSRDKFPSYMVVNALVSEYDELGIDLPHFKVLCELQQRAIKWLEDADPILNQTDLTEEQIPFVEGLIEKGLKTGLKIAQVDNLESYLHSFIWKQTVEDLLQSQNSPTSEKLELELLTALLDEGDVFASNTPTHKELKKLVSLGTRWKKEANAILRSERPKAVSIEYLKDFLESGKNSSIDVGSKVDEIALMITKHDELVGKICQVLKLDIFVNSTKQYEGSLDKVSEYYDELVKLPIESSEKGLVMDAMKKVENLRTSTQPDMGTSFATYSLEQSLIYLDIILSSAHGQLTKMFPNDVFDLEHCRIDSGQIEDESTLFCICQQTSGADSAMVECDKCSEWYHATCVGFRSKPKGRRGRKADIPPEIESTFVCPICTILSQSALSLTEAIQQLRPPNFICTTEENLQRLAYKVKETKLLPDLEDRIIRIQDANASWKENVGRILRNISETCSTCPDIQSVCLLDSVLRQMLKSALSIYMDNTYICQEIFKHLRMNKWRSGALELEKTAKNPEIELSRSLLEDIQSLLDDGVLLGISTNDPVYNRIFSSYNSVVQWKNEAENVLSRLRAMTDRNSAAWYMGSMSIQDLIKRGEKLDWPVPEDLQVIQDNSSLYCLCRKLSDEGSAMIQCDSCEEWFHFECVGRHVPVSAVGEDDPTSWNCPVCSFSLGIPYHAEKSIPKGPEDTLHAIQECLPYLSPVFGQDIYKTILSLFNSAAFQHKFRPGVVPDIVLHVPENQEILKKLERVNLPYSFFTRMNPAAWPSEQHDAPLEIISNEQPKVEQKPELKDEDQILHIDADEEAEPYWKLVD